ncbi:MAG: hypothetical protein U0401_07370 [Anaerolineae bacterium]
MLTAELPPSLQAEFERTASLLHGPDSVTQALIEAIELWLTEQRQKLTQIEAAVNNQAYETMKSDLTQNYPGKWVVIAQGKLQGVADTPEALNHLAPTALHRIVLQIGQTRPQQVELGWQMTLG